MSATPEGPQPISRARLIGVRALLVLGVLLAVVSILATFVKRQALEPDQFKETAQELIASPAIQEQVAAEMVDALYANVDVAAQLEEQLPDNLQGLAGPIAGISRELADRAARELLARPRVQDTFVDLLAASQERFVKVLHGDTTLVDTSNGSVVLDLRPLVLELGDRFNFVNDLADRIPPGSSQIVLLESDNLSTAQDITHWLEQIANWVWILALAAWAAAIWLARGRRRLEIRALGIGLVVVGIIVLVVRAAAGKYLVDGVVVNDSVRPAANDAWRILTQPLADSGWVALAIGLLIALYAWLTGPGARATAARAAIAPVLNRAELAWVSFVVVMILILWILPIQMFRISLILVVAAAAGFVVLRRQSAAETQAPAPAVSEHPESLE